MAEKTPRYEGMRPNNDVEVRSINSISPRLSGAFLPAVVIASPLPVRVGQGGKVTANGARAFYLVTFGRQN